MAYPDYWTCPKCGAVVSNSLSCTNCAYQPPVQQKVGYPYYWTCPKCNSVVLNSPVCTNCNYNPSVIQGKTKTKPKTNLMNSKLVLYGGIGGIVVLGAILVFMLVKGSTTAGGESTINLTDDVLEKGEIGLRIQQQNDEKLNQLKECNPDWECGNWIECEEGDIVQERECVDNAGCNTHLYKPMTMRLC